jgi:hypothetical protein
VLKREATLEWLRAHCDPAETVVYLGIDWSEIHRFERAAPRWLADGWTIAAPLCEPPHLQKSDAQAWLDAEGIARPKLYDLGFGHANCGGGCVKAGIGQFKHLLRADRRWYMRWWEAGEERVRQHLGRTDIAILRDRRGGVTRPMTLRELREQVEASPDLFDDLGEEEQGCGVCFLASPDDEEAA